MMMVGGSCTGIAQTDPGLKAIISGLFGLPFGLIMVLITGSELFTGNAALVTTAVLEGKATLGQLTKSWVFSFGGNIVGSIALAALAVFAGLFTSNPVAVKAAVAKTSLTWGEARPLPHPRIPPTQQPACTHDFHACPWKYNRTNRAAMQAFARGILCNWLVCMAIWMALCENTLPGKATAVLFPIPAFIAIGLEHSVANLFIISAGIMAGAKVSWADMWINNLVPVTLGNIVGGAFCVGFALWLVHRKK